LFCAPELIFLRYRRHQFPFSCFALQDPFWAVPMASGPVFMLCAPRRIFSGTKGVGSRFLCFALPDPFSAVPTMSGPVFLFCAPGPVLDCIEGVGSRFHVLRSKTRFRRYRGRRVSFSCFALPNPFSAVPAASGPVFMFCAIGLGFGGTEGVRSCFLILSSRTRI
jgi:hypothetical protein